MQRPGEQNDRVRALAEKSAQVHRLGMCEATTRSGAGSDHKCNGRLEERTGLVPWPKMAPRCHELGMREATTRSLESAIMAPSLNTASSTISSVGKYLCEINKGLDMHSSEKNPMSTLQPAPLQQNFASAQVTLPQAITLKGLGHDSEGST